MCDLNAWVEEEKDIQTSSNVNITPIVGATAAAALFGVARERLTTFGRVGQMQQDVLRDISQNEDSLPYIAMEGISSFNLEAQNLINETNEKLDQISALMSTQPSYKASKDNFNNFISSARSAIESSTSQIEEDQDDLFDRLVEDGVLTEEDVAQIRQRSSLRSVTKMTISKLGERYFSIQRSDSFRSQDFNENIESAKLKLNGQEIDKISGYQSAEITDNGKLRYNINDEDFIDVDIEQQASPKKSSKKPPKEKFSIASVREDFQFEIWACLMYDIVEWIGDQWQKIKSRIERMISAIKTMKNIAAGSELGFVAGFAQTGFGDLAKIQNALTQTMPIGTIGSELLGLKSDMSKKGIGLNHARGGICNKNKGVYCSISASIRNFEEQFELELNSLNIAIPNIERFSTISDQFDEFINKINQKVLSLDKDVKNIFGDVCSLIERRIAGTPKSVSLAQAGLLELLSLMLTAPSLGFSLSPSPTLTSVLSRIEKDGFLPLRDKILTGDIKGFVSAAELTRAGEVAACLEEAATSEDNADIANRLAIMSRLARTRDQRQTSANRVMDGMAVRLGSNNNVRAAEYIRDEVGRSKNN